MKHITWIIVALFVISCGNPKKGSNDERVVREAVVKKEKPEETEQEKKDREYKEYVKELDERDKRKGDYLEFYKGKSRDTKTTMEQDISMMTDDMIAQAGTEKLSQIYSHKDIVAVFAQHNGLRVYTKQLKKHGFKDLKEALAFLLKSWTLFASGQFEKGKNLCKKYKFKYDVQTLFNYQGRLLKGIRADLGIKDKKR